MTDKPVKRYKYGYKDDGLGQRYLALIEDAEGTVVRITDHEASRAADKARIAELERERDEWHRLFDSAGQVAKNACDDRDSHQRVCMRVIQERDELAEALRVFTGAACPCAIQINSKGYSWSGAYLDEALAVAAPLLAQQGKEGG